MGQDPVPTEEDLVGRLQNGRIKGTLGYAGPGLVPIC